MTAILFDGGSWWENEAGAGTNVQVKVDSVGKAEAHACCALREPIMAMIVRHSVEL